MVVDSLARLAQVCELAGADAFRLGCNVLVELGEIAAPTYRVPAPLPTEIGRATQGVALDWRRPLDYLMTPDALHERDLQPTPETARNEDRDLALSGARGNSVHGRLRPIGASLARLCGRLMTLR